MKLFKERLRELRIEKGLKQDETANELNISRTCYAGWEQGRSEPNIDGIIMLCKFFDITADYLIGIEDI